MLGVGSTQLDQRFTEEVIFADYYGWYGGCKTFKM